MLRRPPGQAVGRTPTSWFQGAVVTVWLALLAAAASSGGL
eukprot:SAG31_NODE_34987_length_327_cov_0.907895_1_plen_39_part_01